MGWGQSLCKPPIHALLMSNRAVCKAYIASIQTESNLTVYSNYILLGKGSGGEKKNQTQCHLEIPTCWLLLQFYSCCSGTLCRRQNVKNFCNDLILLVGRHCLSLRPRVEFSMKMAFAFVLVYATPVTSAELGEDGFLTSSDCRSPRNQNGNLCNILYKFHPPSLYHLALKLKISSFMQNQIQLCYSFIGFNHG